MNDIDNLPMTPEREKALQHRIRDLHKQKVFNYSELLEDIEEAKRDVINKIHEQEKSDRLRKPSSSTFSRWLTGSADLEKEWVLWLEQHLNARRLTTDYDRKRELISAVSPHYISHAVGHYVRIKPETQAVIEKEAPGLYVIWIPSSILPGAFVLGMARITVAEAGVLTIQTLQEYKATDRYFSEIYLGDRMRELGWGGGEKSQPEELRKALHGPPDKIASEQADLMRLLYSISAQPSAQIIALARNALGLQDAKELTTEQQESFRKKVVELQQQHLDTLIQDARGKAVKLSLPQKRINKGTGYFYRIRGALEAHVWDEDRVSYTRYDLPDFERDLGRISYMKGICQTRFGMGRHLKPVIFQRVSHWDEVECLREEQLEPLLDIYPPDMLPIEVRAFFVRAAEKMKSNIIDSGGLIIET